MTEGIINVRDTEMYENGLRIHEKVYACVYPANVTLGRQIVYASTIGKCGIVEETLRISNEDAAALVKILAPLLGLVVSEQLAPALEEKPS